MSDVVLVCMPFVDLPRPNLGISLLKAILERDGISTSTRYGTLELAERLGLAAYLALTSGTRHWDTVLLGDWVFRAAAFPEEASNRDQVLALLAASMDPAALGRLADLLDLAQAEAVRLVDDMARDIVASRPRIVGCTSTFMQHVASLALLRRVRELEPTVATMMGGANCETVMGRATHVAFPWVDFVVSGEADGLVVELCRRVMEGDRGASDWPVGVLAPGHRTAGYPVVAGNPRDPIGRATFQALDTLPYPDYTDWFARLEASPLAPAFEVGLPLETSRGCWWGARTHCTFCGLNGGGMGYRSKSPERALAEMEWLADRWGSHRMQVADNILDMRYLDTVIPRLRDSGRPWSIFWEVKANLKPAQVAALAAAGVRHQQPGIESLDTRVLRLMRKGARTWNQVQYLKGAREHGIEVTWNTLIDFPREDDAWYEETAALIPLLVHLPPPSGISAIRYDRYSPHFDEREAFGLELAPHVMLPLVLPMSEAELEQQCYHFRAVSGPNPPWQQRPGVQRLVTEIGKWQAAFWRAHEPMLVRERVGDELRIHDVRPCAVQAETVLRGLDAEVHEACEEAAGLASILGSVKAEEGAVAASLARLTALRLVLEADGRWLALALSPAAPSWPYGQPFPGGSVDASKAPPTGAELFQRMFLQQQAV